MNHDAADIHARPGAAKDFERVIRSAGRATEKEFPGVTLDTRRMGRTEMTPKALGLGCGHLGDAYGTGAEAVATIREAIEQGIDFVDTSPYYGVSEERVGLALANGWRDRVHLNKRLHPIRDTSVTSPEVTTWNELKPGFRVRV